MTNFEELWMKQKRELLGIIKTGKEENEKPFEEKQYKVIRNGDEATAQLIRMCEMECELYFFDEEQELANVINCNCSLPFETPEGNRHMEDDLK